MKPAVTPLEEWTRRKLGLKADQPVTRQELRDWWLLRLRQTLAWARERSPFYRWRLRGQPEDPLDQVEDLAKLPFTTAEDLRREHRGMLCTSQGEVARIVTLRSSGTTAEPKRLYFSQEDLELTLDFFHHGMSTLTDPGRTARVMQALLQMKKIDVEALRRL
jgi:phenylacetate-coenzyme A ligase PaaK-like adenylate-forming protein